MANKPETKPTSAIKLVAISIIALCAFAGCKDDSNGGDQPPIKTTPIDIIGVWEVCGSEVMLERYGEYIFLTETTGKYVLHQDSYKLPIDTIPFTYTLEYPHIIFDKAPHYGNLIIIKKNQLQDESTYIYCREGTWWTDED